MATFLTNSPPPTVLKNKYIWIKMIFRTWPSICHQLSWMLNLATLSLLANADHFLRLSDSMWSSTQNHQDRRSNLPNSKSWKTHWIKNDLTSNIFYFLHVLVIWFVQWFVTIRASFGPSHLGYYSKLLDSSVLNTVSTGKRVISRLVLWPLNTKTLGPKGVRAKAWLEHKVPCS